MNCLNCNIEFTSKRSDAKYCSDKCKKEAFFKRSIGTDKSKNGTDNLVMAERIISEQFKFTIKVGNTDPKNPPYNDEQVVTDKSKVRTAKYWYDVPLAAVPIIQKDWPEMPDYVNGRQYFLWWKNEFKTQPDGTPIIHNPFPAQSKLEYIQAGEGSRRWGTT